jgi:hypothetical protein
MTPEKQLRIIRMVKQIVTSELRRRTKVQRHSMDKRTAAQHYEQDLMNLKELLNEKER